MRTSLFSLLAVSLCLRAAGAQESAKDRQAMRPADPNQKQERTSFQTGAHWDPMLQLRSDVAMCYGIDPSITGRIAEWKKQGYIVHVMTGVSWGEYQDYLYGRFDGINHVDEAQTERNGNVISHGGDVYYMSPGINYGKFLSQGVKRAIDAGADAIHLEEPEFWVRGSYGKGFEREWKAYYKEDWIPAHTSPDAQWRASRLKYYLYGRALKQIFDFVKDYNKQTGKHVRCYVPTHSLINYSQWNIVSPESSLLQVGADGFIAQVWTGTSRTPNVYEGKLKERTFETAFLEYGAMMNIVRASGSTVWFLNDPIEDNPNHTWHDYRTNWESTLTASLLWPQVARFEVMPWPERIFHGKYPTQDNNERRPGEETTRIPIPPAYATELMTVINALNNMKQPQIGWESGTRGIGVVISDTLMFQRGDPKPSDEHLGSFYGLALPLVKRGMPVEPVQLENAAAKPESLSPYKILLLTYEGMKPMTPEANDALAKWVKQGGVLIFLGDDSDPFNTVRAWWNTAPNTFKSPREHLFTQLGLSKDAAAGTYTVGNGTLLYDASSPAALTYQATGADHIRQLAQQASKLAKLPYRETNYLALRRGPYIVAAGLDESLTEAPHTLRGHFINLFDAELPILTEVSLTPGSRFLLYDLDKKRAETPAVLASACKTLGEQRTDSGGFRFYAEGPDQTQAAIRVALPTIPGAVLVDDAPLPADGQTWDKTTKTLLIRFPNAHTGRWVTIR